MSVVTCRLLDQLTCHPFRTSMGIRIKQALKEPNQDWSAGSYSVDTVKCPKTTL
jgi:hypothetical protein